MNVISFTPSIGETKRYLGVVVSYQIRGLRPKYTVVYLLVFFSVYIYVRDVTSSINKPNKEAIIPRLYLSNKNMYLFLTTYRLDSHKRSYKDDKNIGRSYY